MLDFNPPSGATLFNGCGLTGVLRLARICIVTPGQVGSNPRVVKEANALVEAGHEVGVVSTKVSKFVESRDLEIIHFAEWAIHRIEFNYARWKIERLCQRLSQHAFSLTGGLAFAASAHSVVARNLTRRVRAIPADLYIAHYPAALCAAAGAAKVHNACYAYDAEDFHLGDWPEDERYDKERLFVRSIEGQYLRGCAFVTAASPMIADALVCAYGISRPKVVLNVFPKNHAPANPSTKGSADPGPSIYWFSQTIGPDRGLETAVRAIALTASRPYLYLRGTVADGYKHSLSSLAIEVGVRDRIHFLEPVLPSTMERAGSDYDLGLAAETGVTANRSMCLTNKIFSFILSGLPPLMSDTPAQMSFAADAGLDDLTFPHDDPPQLATLMDRFLLDSLRLAEIRRYIWRIGQERYNWEAECGIIINNVKSCV